MDRPKYTNQDGNWKYIHDMNKYCDELEKQIDDLKDKISSLNDDVDFWMEMANGGDEDD